MHTRLLRAVAALSIAALALLGSTAGPATAASPPTTIEIAYAAFSHPQGEPTTMDLSVSSSDGAVTLDARWTSITCQPTDSGQVCMFAERDVAAATPATFDFSLSLQQATVTADVPYNELRWTCTFSADTESCTDRVPTGSGSTHVDLAWTATGQARTTTFRDEGGQVFVQRIAPAQATGEAFGEVFTLQRNEGSQLGITKLVQPGS
jgi:hypothetical protein